MQGARDEVGPRHSGHFGLCASRRETLADAERGAHGYRLDLDKVVSDYQAQELSVRLTRIPIFYSFQRETGLTKFNSLAAVNFFLGMVGIVQVTRITLYHQSQKNAPAASAVEEVKEAVKSV
jgi:hypothetical protein